MKQTLFGDFWDTLKKWRRRRSAEKLRKEIEALSFGQMREFFTESPRMNREDEEVWGDVLCQELRSLIESTMGSKPYDMNPDFLIEFMPTAKKSVDFRNILEDAVKSNAGVVYRKIADERWEMSFGNALGWLKLLKAVNLLTKEWEPLITALRRRLSAASLEDGFLTRL